MIWNWAGRSALARIVCALAIFMLGFSANAFALPNLEPYGAEYRLPDGTFASLCLPSEEHGAPHGDFSKHCDMCVMAVGHLFTAPGAIVTVLPASRPGQTNPLAAGANPGRILSHHGQSRGPPLSA